MNRTPALLSNRQLEMGYYYCIFILYYSCAKITRFFEGFHDLFADKQASLTS